MLENVCEKQIYLREFLLTRSCAWFIYISFCFSFFFFFYRIYSYNSKDYPIHRVMIAIEERILINIFSRCDRLFIIRWVIFFNGQSFDSCRDNTLNKESYVSSSALLDHRSDQTVVWPFSFSKKSSDRTDCLIQFRRGIINRTFVSLKVRLKFWKIKILQRRIDLYVEKGEEKEEEEMILRKYYST